MSDVPTKRLHSVKEVAAALSISERTVHRMVKDGRLQSIRLGDRVLFDSQMIDDLLAAARGAA